MPAKKKTAKRKVRTRKPPAARPLGSELADAARGASGKPSRKARSTSARAKEHDFEALYAQVMADRDEILSGPVIIDWDERFVHAIDRALYGRKLDDLLHLLDNRHYLHPILLPALADAIRSQRDAARGAGRRLTQRQDATIRNYADKKVAGDDTIAYLASLFGLSTDAIRKSLKRTGKPKEK